MKTEKLLKNKFIWIGAAALLLIIIIIAIWSVSAPREKATSAQGQYIWNTLYAENVTVQNVTVTRSGYEITYAAESAVGRFDDAMLYDWATIYAVSATQHCDTVSIVTTLDGQPMERQTASCPAVRALARGVLTEKEFWMLVKHESVS